MSEYNKFVQLHYASAPGINSKEKFKSIALLWKDHKAKHGIKPRSHRKSKAGATVAGSLFGDIVPFGNMLGLGMKKPKKGGAMVAGSVDSGGYFFENPLGLGMKKPRKSKKGGAMVAGSVDSGGSFIDDIVGSVANFKKLAPMIGLGMDENAGEATKGGVMSSETYENVRKALFKEVKKKDFKKKLHAHLKGKGIDASGGSFLDGMVDGITQGFQLPFKALGSLF